MSLKSQGHAINDAEYAHLFAVLGVTYSIQENKCSSFLALIIEWLSNFPTSFQYYITSLFPMLFFLKGPGVIFYHTYA